MTNSAGGADLARAISRACAALVRSQREDGSWDERSDVGPASTANVLCVLDHAGMLPASELSRGTRWLRSRQLADGSFRPYPFAHRGNLSTTAQCWAALSLSREAEDVDAAERAKSYVMAHGGLDLVLDEMRSGEMAAVYLALVGLLPAGRLPAPPIEWCLVPPVTRELATRFHFGVLIGSIQLTLIARRLQGRYGADGTKRSWLERRVDERAIELMTLFQNRDGSWNGNTVQTALAIPALLAAGLSVSDERVQRAARWLRSRRVDDRDGSWYDVFSSDVWSTAFTLRALVLSGARADSDVVQKGLSWLADAQLETPMPWPNQRRKGAKNTGGWPFQTGNETMADCDDGGIVLSVFGLAQRDESLPAPLRLRLSRATDKARGWLHDMQNADGGWPAFVWGLPAQRPSRPLFATPIDLPPGSYLKAMRALIWPIPELEDPSTEDLTARVLHGLGSTGARTDDPMVARGLAFLRDHQSEAGGWWGRWVCNYLASTAYVLGALARVGEDLDEAYVKRAIEWTLSCQNADGGWGESTESYLDPEKAGRGPSTAPLTALVVQGLVECGEGERVEVEKAIAYLIAKQRPDGTWPNDDYVATNIPPQGFYVYDGAARHMPLEALARYARRQELLPEAPLETGAGRFTSALLEPMRRVTDPLADDVVHAIYGDHDIGKVNALLASILDNDDPVPPGLPKEAQAFFDTTTALPAWHDPKKTARAQAIFDEFGVYVTFGLFCSSLPQAYCASHGAVVLIQTGALLDRVRQRIFETAQFLFDVMDEDSLGPNGRAIRSAQRVRLMHAAVRCLIRHHHGARWDVAKLGEPINQEDLAGTLMTFSVVTYDAARRLGVALSPADADAWIHHWCVIGHVLGIREELLPKGLGEAQQLMDAIRQRQWTPSPQSRELARALVDMMQEFFTQDARALDGLTPTLIRYLAGDHCADLLGLPPSDWTELMVTALRDATDLIDIDDREGWLERQLGRVTGTSMRWIADVERGSKRASFRIPASLRATVVPGT